jgi:hypothetical protein
MDDIIEISEFDLDNNFNSYETPGKSSSFGSGIELLMNDKISSSKSSKNSDMNLEDLNNLENELNDLVEETTGKNESFFSPKSDIFGTTNSGNYEKQSGVRFDDMDDASSIGRATADTFGESKTWDGYGKFNNIPLNPDKEISMEPKLSREETLRAKFNLLRKFDALTSKGVQISKKYDMESSLSEMQGEYAAIMDEKSKQNSIKFQGNMLMACINGLEFLNNRFDPFDIKLDGFSDQVSENISDYDEIFGELYEKYKSKASMAPELKLLFQLGGSAMMVHMTNTMFKSAMPGMDDIMRQNPDLMRSFQNAAVNSMSQSNPGFSGFMNNIVGNNSNSSNKQSGPPPPLATKPQPQQPLYSQNRQDLNYGRSNFVDEGMKPNSPPAKTRPEMKGPSDISSILAGVRTKTINIQEPVVNNTNNNENTNNNSSSYNDSSTISLNDLQDLNVNGTMPKRSKRRQKSNNAISLDI